MQTIPPENGNRRSHEEYSDDSSRRKPVRSFFQLKLYRFFRINAFSSKKSSAFFKKKCIYLQIFFMDALSTKIEGAMKLINKLSTPMILAVFFKKAREFQWK